MNGKGTDTFKTAIQNYLEYRAATDVLATFVYALVGVGKQGCKEFIGCCSVFQIVLNSHLECICSFSVHSCSL